MFSIGAYLLISQMLKNICSVYSRRINSFVDWFEVYGALNSCGWENLCRILAFPTFSTFKIVLAKMYILCCSNCSVIVLKTPVVKKIQYPQIFNLIGKRKLRVSDKKKFYGFLCENIWVDNSTIVRLCTSMYY